MRKKTYIVPHRRRRERKTDYRRRLNLLKSKKPRLVIRKTTNNIVCQVVSHDPKGDKTTITTNSKSLGKLGWKGHSGSIPSAYLIGYIAGKEAQKKGVKEAIVDMGLKTPTKWSRLFAALHGAADSGLKIPHSKEILLPNERVSGKHIAQYAEKVDKEKYKKLFSGYLKKKLNPEDLPKHFEEIKKKI